MPRKKKNKNPLAWPNPMAKPKNKIADLAIEKYKAVRNYGHCTLKKWNRGYPKARSIPEFADAHAKMARAGRKLDEAIREHLGG